MWAIGSRGCEALWRAQENDLGYLSQTATF